MAVGSAHAAYTDDLRKETWLKTWDLNLNALTFCAPGKAMAVGAKGLSIVFSLP